jgi:hypothetical protein
VFLDMVFLDMTPTANGGSPALGTRVRAVVALEHVGTDAFSLRQRARGSTIIDTLEDLSERLV